MIKIIYTKQSYVENYKLIEIGTSNMTMNMKMNMKMNMNMNYFDTSELSAGLNEQLSS